ncbi:MAG: hypothetical protein M4579_000599 [Chaenotheca gracillima]|nr:MAG: hypothetical protein M4579_000599 [Chaenotheca gracillima]
MPGPVSDGPTVSMSFANNFWGRDDAGVHPLLSRMHDAKVTSDEVKSFYSTRAAIEDEYARKLLSLSRKPLGSAEAGTLRTSLDTIRGEVESMGKAHGTIATQMKSELDEPLAAFSGALKERRKIVQTGIEKLLKVKTQQTQTVNKARDRYEQDCLRIKGYLAQGHMVMGQEERKNKAKLEKTQIQLATTSNEYEAAVKILEETTGRWNREWKAACDKFQDLEEERLDFMKSSLWSFANIASTVCVSDDASCEKMRLSLENCEVEKDIGGFIRDSGTGQEIPDPPKYINFCRGDVNDSQSETSEDDYSVAQFQRTINPAFRSSSPAASAYESHHDPKSNLAMQMSNQETYTPPSRERTVTPQKAALQMGKPSQPDFGQRSQIQAKVAQYADQHEPLAPVPHNEYPTDGMTMYCRTDATSERSSAASPARPSSRDSHSEYSNPTSFSSQEAPMATNPAVKSSKSMDLASSPGKQVQKKRSGFFQGHSPFRRKSKHEKDRSFDTQPPPGPASRNTWSSTASRTGKKMFGSPTKQPQSYGQFGTDQRSASPEPVDPRASFQLNVGNNVFDVASPDQKKGGPHEASNRGALDDLDPIAQALAELKGVTKQSSVRMSADRYHGIQTPAPPGTPGVQSAMANGAVAAAQRGTPPPSYDQPTKRLDLPQPAFTSAQMQQTRQKYVDQTQNMFRGSGAGQPNGHGRSQSRPGTRGSGGSQDIPRAASPAPPRGTSPRPGYNSDSHQMHRSVSPNPNNGYGRSSAASSPQKRGSDQGYVNSRQGSPAASQPRNGGNDMQMQLSSGPDAAYDGSQRTRGRSSTNARPVSYYGGRNGGDFHDQPPAQQQNSRRSKSVADGRQFNQDGRPILHHARALYLYQAAIPEELTFAKGDILAVLRLQDDGWWEAELVNDDGPPSNESSPYIHSLASTLQSAGHTISVVLPHIQRSWIGKAHIVGALVKPTYFRPGTLHQDDGTTHSRPLPPGSKGEEWILIDGSPASCVQVGLYHFFQDRGPVDLVLSGPNYGRNTTAVFGLSSGTLGGALEGAVCGKRSIALSYAFFSRDHDSKIIAAASRLSVKLIEHLCANWNHSVDVYSINVPLVTDVENHKILYTNMLQNKWSSGSAFQEVPPDDGDEDDPEQHEKSIRLGDQVASNSHETLRHQHKCLKWAPAFADVHKSVEASPPGNDGWAIREGYTSVTPLKANFMHSDGIQGEIKLPSRPSLPSHTRNDSRTTFSAIIDYEDSSVQPLILSALQKVLPKKSFHLIKSVDELRSSTDPLLQISSYETLPFEHALTHRHSSLVNAYIIRKALIRKHYLANTIASWLAKNPASILKRHFKAAVDFELDYAEFLDEALVEAFELQESFAENEGKEAQDRQWWILKPGMSDRGQGIRLFSTEEELQAVFEGWELENPEESDDEGPGTSIAGSQDGDDSHPSDDRSTNDKSGIITSQLRHFIAQPYIHPPLLLPSIPRKFHIRTYVLALGSLQVYVYKDMLALFASTPYIPPWHPDSANNADLSAHLTNTCLQATGAAGPASKSNKDADLVYSFWDLPTFSIPPKDGAPEARESSDWKDSIFEQILAITSETFLAACRTTAVHFQPLPNAFEVFGLDFLVDMAGTAWLLEINAFPDFAQTGEQLMKRVVGGFWDGVVKTAVEPWWDGLQKPQDEGIGATAGAKEEGGESSGMKKVLDIDLGRRS